MPRWKKLDLATFRENAESMTARDLAAKFGLSRQRVYQIAAREGLKLLVPVGRPWARGKRKQQSRIETAGLTSDLNPGTSGRICELLVAANLMAMGWKIYFPLNGHGDHDLVAWKKGRGLKSFEVRAARRVNPTTVRFSRDRIMRSDHYAIVIKGEPVMYEPLID